MTTSKKVSMNVGIELDSTGPTNNIIEEEQEESKENISSFENSSISIDEQNVLKKADCLRILQSIIAIKREQTFCVTEDSQIFTGSKLQNSSSKSVKE